MKTVVEHFDVVIIGAGAAGLSAALDLAPLSVAVLSANPFEGDCSSRWSQGGFAAAVGPGDSPRAHAQDTLHVADGLADWAVAQRLTLSAPAAVRQLEESGVRFEKKSDGYYSLNREAGHSAHRVLHARAGDGFGRELMRALSEKTRACPAITVFENTIAFELLRNRHGVVCGVAAQDKEGVLHLFHARAVILASGGIGGLYAETTNPLINTGAGLALAARAGAVLSDLEFMQFHPTALDIGLDPAPLATEALRGAGARLINEQGLRFVDELAPRDVVARAIFSQRHAGQKAYLDCRHFITADAFPNLFEAAARAGLDPRRDSLPVMPAAHYHMGGVATDLRGRSSVAGLWACGEVAATGLHGANRLASNSLMEAVIVGGNVARDIRHSLNELALPAPFYPDIHIPQQTADLDLLRRLFSDRLGVVRNAHGLMQAITAFYEAEKSPAANLRDAALVGRLVASMAFLRTESRGGHSRSDFPGASALLKKRRFLTLEQITAALPPVDVAAAERIHA